MKMKRIYRMIIPVMLAALLCGCGDGREYDGREDSRRESRDREESDDRPEESVPEESAPEEEAEEPLLTSAFASAKPGNELQFGACEQDNNLSNGAEPIEWVVLANEGDKILVLSKYVLDGEVSYKLFENVTWETSAERELLNNTFYEEAFSEEEKRCILESSITTPDTEGTWRGRGNQLFKSNGGSATSDFLFFLSSEEVEEYVQPLGIAAAETTAASTVHVEESTGYSMWLLRSPGPPSGADDWPDDYAVTARGYSDEFAAIDAENGNQYRASSDGVEDIWFVSGRLGKAGYDHSYGMRPAMWLTLQ